LSTRTQRTLTRPLQPCHVRVHPYRARVLGRHFSSLQAIMARNARKDTEVHNRRGAGIADEPRRAGEALGAANGVLISARGARPGIRRTGWAIVPGVALEDAISALTTGAVVALRAVASWRGQPGCFAIHAAPACLTSCQCTRTDGVRKRCWWAQRLHARAHGAVCAGRTHVTRDAVCWIRLHGGARTIESGLAQCRGAT